jgi:MFS family permease
MKLTPALSRHNYRAFLWHSVWLALAKNFMDVDTVIPALLVETGGQAVHLGMITAIMLGGASFTQLLFAPLLSNRAYKKTSLLWGINVRILALLGLAVLMFFSGQLGQSLTLILIFALIIAFSLGGAFAGIGYTDILGKSILPNLRKPFFSIRQVIMGVGAFASALLVQIVLTSWSYPSNYTFMLLIGWLALWLASLGFWRLREVLPSELIIRNTRHFLNVAQSELRQHPRLKYFLGFVNTQGISIAFLPFVILYAKETFDTEAADTGRFLFAKVVGGVSISMLIFVLSKKVKYRYLLYGNGVLAMMLPLVVVLAQTPYVLSGVFLLGGIVISVYAIAMNGVLLEISGTNNRTLYSGIAGAGNVIPAIFPVLAGWLISWAGYTSFFICYIVIVFSSFYFIYKINCLR